MNQKLGTAILVYSWHTPSKWAQNIIPVYSWHTLSKRAQITKKTAKASTLYVLYWYCIPHCMPASLHACNTHIIACLQYPHISERMQKGTNKWLLYFILYCLLYCLPWCMPYYLPYWMPYCMPYCLPYFSRIVRHIVYIHISERMQEKIEEWQRPDLKISSGDCKILRLPTDRLIADNSCRSKLLSLLGSCCVVILLSRNIPGVPWLGYLLT